ncbi:phosphoinositide 3-kinase regulatory subunit 4-like [Limulus polyphemus]|uniref:non-specific serine/threonine protein kinase n=1 Tax=Limulus polyphemus TaxID=6850 RepID=A0ABM1TII6_LIMPO|nr:phosphoinositide 3-kinase regulatory subunit 4-like [Limulus polyphemus]
MAQDEAVMVRMAYAENIAVLAETALCFLEKVQLDEETLNVSSETSTIQSHHNQASYDTELQALHELVQQSVSTLLSDPENAVKQMLLEKGITQLCVFFGQQKANDVLLSHMITFLNDKVRTFGPYISTNPGENNKHGVTWVINTTGLADTEEFVISKTLTAMTDLAELGLLQKQMCYELVQETIPLLCHPNLWLRQGTVGFICAVARTLNLADVHCKLAPLLQPFLQQQIIQVDQEVVLLDAVKTPVSRVMFDYLVKLPNLPMLLESLRDRQILRSIIRSGHQLAYGDMDDGLKSVYRRLQSDGLTEVIEDKILAMKDHLLKIHKAKSSLMDSRMSLSKEKDGVIDLTAYNNLAYNCQSVDLGVLEPGVDVQQLSQNRCEVSLLNRRVIGHVPMNASFHMEDPGRVIGHMPMNASFHMEDPGRVIGHMPMNASFHMEDPGRNEEWQHMFGTTDSRGLSPAKQDPSDITLSTSTKHDQASSGNTALPCVPMHQNFVDSAPHGASSAQCAGRISPAPHEIASLTYQCVPCKQELNLLIKKKQDESAREHLIIEASENMGKEDVSPPHKWHPQGTLVAHLHEHRGAVNRLQVIPNTSLFATCSNDGTVKIWDGGRMIQGRNIANRSRQTYSRMDGQVISLTSCHNLQSLAAATDTGNIHVFSTDEADDRTQICKYEGKSIVSTDEADDRTQICKYEGESIVSTDEADDRTQICKYEGESIVSTDEADDRTQICKYEGKSIASTDEADDRTQICKYEGENIVSTDEADDRTQICKYEGKSIVSTDKAGDRTQICKYEGLITSYCVDPHNCWLVVGTSSGNLVCWDLRFQLPITTVTHPTGARVRRLLLHPQQQSSVLCAVRGNNEVSLWDLETGARQLTLWASNAPPLSQTQATNHAMFGMYLSPMESGSFLLTAGSDMRIRYWDLNYPADSYIVAGAANDPLSPTVVSYRSRLVDGTEVIQEMYTRPRTSSTDDPPRRCPEMPPAGHHDCISDLGIFQTSQCFLVSAARDGVVKLWK